MGGDGRFRMVVTDVFWLSSRPLPVVRAESYEGETAVGDELHLIGQDGSRRQVVVRGIPFVCRPGQPPEDHGYLDISLGDGLTASDLAVGQVLEARSDPAS